MMIIIEQLLALLEVLLMYQTFDGGTIVKMDETYKRINTLITIGYSLPFDSFTIFLKFDKQSYFDRDRYYLLAKDFSKTEVSEVYVKILARNKQILLINQSQFKLLIELAKKDNEGGANLTKEICEMIYQIGFLTKEELQLIRYVE